jgi:hypothetical protein
MSYERTKHNNQKRNFFYETDRKINTNFQLHYMKASNMTTTKTNWELMFILV